MQKTPSNPTPSDDAKQPLENEQPAADKNAAPPAEDSNQDTQPAAEQSPSDAGGSGPAFSLHVNGAIFDLNVGGLGFDFDLLQQGTPQFAQAFSPQGDTPSRTVEDVIASHPARHAAPIEHDLLPEPAKPIPPFGIYDPLFSKQWYLHNTSGGIDINVVDAWKDYTGKGVVIGSIDDGLEYTHPDLVPNYLPEFGYDAVLETNDPSPKSATNNHGTVCFGLITAAKNGYGIVGVAYDSTFSSARIQYDGNYDTQSHVRAVQHSAYADVLNMSYNAKMFNWANPIVNEYIKLATTGRDGLGTILVHSNGNARTENVIGGYDPESSLPTHINVAALNSDGHYSYFSSPSAATLISAPGHQMIADDRVAPNGCDPNASFATLSGTSFSAPLVSGAAALMLEANPNLGYRDVASILAMTAKHTTAATSDFTKPWRWQINAAHNVNGGGMHVSHDYGFGLLDTTAAVRLAESWDQGSHTMANLGEVHKAMSVSTVIPDNGEFSSSVFVDSPFTVESVMLEMTIHGGHASELQAILYAPSGTYSWFLDNSPEAWDSKMPKTFGLSDTCSFGSTQTRGENGQGEWTLVILDKVTGNEHTLESWTLNLYGENPDGNDLYVYTNEFANMAAEDATRTTLSDSGGTDTLNASAVSTASVIDLNPGATSIIDGAELHIAAGTVIEKAHGGDGNDTIIGNAVANELFGWRGNDVITGGLGADKLTGGTGADLFRFENAAQGGDTIMDFSHADDGFLFNHGAFGQAGAGSLDAANFFTDRSAVAGDDASFIFEGDTLWFDADGAGAGAAVEIAQVHGDAVQANDITFA